MTDPFRDDTTALDARMHQIREEIEELRARLLAYEGENRDAVIAAHLSGLRAEIEAQKVERERLLGELRWRGHPVDPT
jgi:hypothetical protein